MGKLNGKVAIVTGATAGIGMGIAEVFLEEGAKVVFCGRRAEKGAEIESALKEKGYDAYFVQADMNKDEDIQRLFDNTIEKYGRLDIQQPNMAYMALMGHSS